MSKLTKEEFQAYLKQIRELAEGPLEEIQKEVEVTNKFPQEFYDLAIENNLYRCSLPEEYGGWGLNELEILQEMRSHECLYFYLKTQSIKCLFIFLF